MQRGLSVGHWQAGHVALAAWSCLSLKCKRWLSRPDLPGWPPLAACASLSSRQCGRRKLLPGNVLLRIQARLSAAAKPSVPLWQSGIAALRQSQLRPSPSLTVTRRTARPAAMPTRSNQHGCVDHAVCADHLWR